MSGAEFVAVIGIAASVIQVVDSCKRVIDRLRDFRDNLQFEDVSIQLALLMTDVQRLESQDAEASLDKATKEALARVLQGYLRQLNALDELLQSMTSAETASKFRRTWKGIRSFGKDTKLRRIMGILTEYKTTLNLHLSARSAITPPSEKTGTEAAKSYFEIPKKSVSYFVGRTNLLLRIKEAFNSSKSNPAIAILTGIGGQGKTQCALKFCQEARASYRGIFWIDASTKISATRSFETVVEKLSSKKEFPDTESKIKFVKETLQSWAEPWLLVFDNYDDPRTFNNICSFFPTANNAIKSSILITSRHIATERLGTAIKVDGLSEIESLALLFQGSDVGTLDEKTVAEGKKIVKQLGYLALAIDQAAAYISIRQLPLELFVDHFTQRKEVILKHTPDTLWEYQTIQDEQNGVLSNLSVFTTWEMSFQQIGDDEEKRRQTGQFLTCCAFLDVSNISEELFREYAQHGDFNEAPIWLDLFMTAGKWDTFSFQDVIVGLMSLNLVQSTQTTSDGMRFSFHPLVKDWLQLRESEEISPSSEKPEKASTNQVKKSRSWNTLQAAKITANFIHIRNINALTFSTRQEILGHIDTSLENIKQFMESYPQNLRDSNYDTFLKDYATTFATFLGLHDRYTSAEKLFLTALEWQTNRLDTWDVASLRTANNLGIMYLDMRNSEKAKEMLEGALEGKEKLLGNDDALTLNTVNNLGNLYSTYSMLSEAAAMYSRALLGFLKIRDPSHHSIREVRNNLGEVLMKQGRYQEAETMFQIALKGQENVSVDTNALTLYIQSNLAIVYKAQGEVDQAIETYKKVITGREILLGPDHSSTISSKRELADVYYEFGQHKLAEQIFPGYEELRSKGLSSLQNRSHGASSRNLGSICKGHSTIPRGSYDHPARSGLPKSLTVDERTDGDHFNDSTARSSSSEGWKNHIARAEIAERNGWMVNNEANGDCQVVMGNSPEATQPNMMKTKQVFSQLPDRIGPLMIDHRVKTEEGDDRSIESDHASSVTPSLLSSSSTFVEGIDDPAGTWSSLPESESWVGEKADSSCRLGVKYSSADDKRVVSEDELETAHFDPLELSNVSSKLVVLEDLVDGTQTKFIDRSGAAIRNQMCAIKSLARIRKMQLLEQGLEDQIPELELDLQNRLKRLDERLENKRREFEGLSNSNNRATYIREQDTEEESQRRGMAISERHAPPIIDRQGPSIIDRQSPLLIARQSPLIDKGNGARDAETASRSKARLWSGNQGMDHCCGDKEMHNAGLKIDRNGRKLLNMIAQETYRKMHLGRAGEEYEIRSPKHLEEKFEESEALLEGKDYLRQEPNISELKEEQIPPASMLKSERLGNGTEIQPAYNTVHLGVSSDQRGNRFPIGIDRHTDHQILKYPARSGRPMYSFSCTPIDYTKVLKNFEETQLDQSDGYSRHNELKRQPPSRNGVAITEDMLYDAKGSQINDSCPHRSHGPYSIPQRGDTSENGSNIPVRVGFMLKNDELSWSRNGYSISNKTRHSGRAIPQKEVRSNIEGSEGLDVDGWDNMDTFNRDKVGFENRPTGLNSLLTSSTLPTTQTNTECPEGVFIPGPTRLENQLNSSLTNNRQLNGAETLEYGAAKEQDPKRRASEDSPFLLEPSEAVGLEVHTIQIPLRNGLMMSNRGPSIPVHDDWKEWRRISMLAAAAPLPPPPPPPPLPGTREAEALTVQFEEKKRRENAMRIPDRIGCHMICAPRAEVGRFTVT